MARVRPLNRRLSPAGIGPRGDLARASSRSRLPRGARWFRWRRRTRVDSAASPTESGQRAKVSRCPSLPRSSTSSPRRSTRGPGPRSPGPQAAARSHFRLAEVPAVIEANFRERFSPQEQADIELVARTMTWMNRASNTVDAALSRLRGRTGARRRVLRELTAVVLYALITPFILVIVSVKQRRSPISLIAGIGAVLPRVRGARALRTAAGIRLGRGVPDEGATSHPNRVMGPAPPLSECAGSTVKQSRLRMESRGVTPCQMR